MTYSADTLNGDSGDDLIDLNVEGAYIIDGGTGSDTVRFNFNGSAVGTSYANIETADVVGSLGIEAGFLDNVSAITDTFNNYIFIQHETGGSSDWTGLLVSGVGGEFSGVTGAAHSFNVSSADAAWFLFGADLDDVLTSGSGDDSLIGEAGNDILSFCG